MRCRISIPTHQPALPSFKKAKDFSLRICMRVSDGPPLATVLDTGNWLPATGKLATVSALSGGISAGFTSHRWPDCRFPWPFSGFPVTLAAVWKEMQRKSLIRLSQ